jgi:serine/threonine protein phosphatase PrpC
VAKQLRIETAELTDIGRRRNDNQDNMGRRVPDDPEELERDGALFVVADGMGGHAAGEIASTVAVQTMTSAYFDAAHGEVLQGLAQAIKQSNEAILSIARENAGRTGMGTTLVAAVLCQGILYVANIGDSRAYLLRNGRLRQLTEDHSWVAEQVRAGVLTEDQARTHVHRNVITRSLGTQANVTADVFVEPAREGDILLLCSDGLHGYVSDEVIRETIAAFPPTEAAKRLVDLANEAGGPDNITVSIFRIDEMEEASPEVLARLQLLKTQPRANQPTAIIAKAPEKPALAAPPPPEPLDATEAAPSPTPAPRRNQRAGVWALRIAAVLLIIAFSAAAWDYTLGPFAKSRLVAARVSADIAKTHTDIQTLSAHSIPEQLSILAADQQQLQADLGLDLTASERSDITQTLTGDLTPAVQGALNSYNAQAHIVPLAEANAQTVAVPCATQVVAPLIPVNAPAGATTMFFARNLAGQAQPITLANGQATCGKPLGGNILAVTGTGGGLAALLAPNGKTPAQVALLQPNGSFKAILNLAALGADVTFTSLAYSDKAIVVVEHGDTGDTLAVFSGPKFAPTAVKTVPVPQGVRAVGYGRNAVVYLLLADGSLATFVPGASTALHPVGGLQIEPALPTAPPSDYTSATPVPTVPPSSSTAFLAPMTQIPHFSAYAGAAANPQAALATGTPSPTPPPTATPLPTGSTAPSTPLASATDLAVDGAAVPLVSIADGKGHRVVLLNASGIDLTLIQQYAAASQLDSVAAVTFSLDQHTLFALTDAALIQIQLP